MNRTSELLGATGPDGLHVADLLPAIAAQAAAADASRSVAPEVIAAIKRSDILALSASAEIGGLGASVGHIAAELGAVAAACGSTAWCLWNHLCVFHLYCGGLGPAHADLLGGIVAGHQWVCFPGGAGSRVHGRAEGDHIVLEGSATFGSGCRYADWTGVAFAMVDPATNRIGSPPDLRFSIVELSRPGVSIDATWDGASLRATATDDVYFRGVALPGDRWSTWWSADRAEMLRDPDLPVINHRYREDWVGLSDLWLAAMAVGVTQAALEETVEEVGGRRAIMGQAMNQMAGVQFNLGRAAMAVAGARAATETGCREVDARIAAGVIPTEADYLRQMALSTHALSACDQAMHHLLKTVGGNGLRLSHRFERRFRDFQAMPIHINAHEDRIAERTGRHLLNLAPGLF